METPPRRRGRYDWYTECRGYDTVQHEQWKWDDKGDLLTSRLPNDLHAPVLDVDQPIKVIEDWRNDPTILHFLAHRKLAARIAQRLYWAGLIDKAQYEHYQYLGRKPAMVSTTFLLPFPMRAEPSKTPGHHHLYIQQEMDWNQSLIIAKAFSGLVDKKWIKYLSEEPGMFVRPLTTNVA